MRLQQVGAIAEVTGCDAGMLVQYFDDWIDRLAPIASAILKQRSEERKQPRT